ncbi:zinc finger protein [Pseudoloma neurophilia]|uniref:Zinc finger protein n=1 Tax=Pseudoloma neurophilia TaxID=146866 RepID=A0A0R0LVA2_9MICR|nr:zinc finger protein [Pseudoloma neurophilia]
MKSNLKHSSRIFEDFKKIIERSLNILNKNETILDITDLDLKLKILREDVNIFTTLENYNGVVSNYLRYSDIPIKRDIFLQEDVKINGQSVVCLTNLEENISHSEYSDNLNIEDLLNLENSKFDQQSYDYLNIKDEQSYNEKKKQNEEDQIPSPYSSIQAHQGASDFESDNSITRSGSNLYLDERPFYNKHNEQEEWNVQMIDSIISKITHTEPIFEPPVPQKKKKKVSKTNELSIRPFICEFKDCNSAFKRFEHLKRHNRIHTGERPFKCTFPGCYKKFARSDNLSQHIKIHNMKSRHFSENQLPFYRNKF